VSYVDALVGQLVAGLKTNGLWENTQVVLWGDHGLWCKHTNFELDARAPLIARVPGQSAAGSSTDALVEFVDIYPSLAEAAGLSIPQHVEGTSYVLLLNDPSLTWNDGGL
tara:strand:+ start:1675 stop:2004 length:330 start_codon:yes stop_codon:yes gene_type:complete